MAAPHVAGALAALKSLFPNLSYQVIFCSFSLENPKLV